MIAKSTTLSKDKRNRCGKTLLCVFPPIPPFHRKPGILLFAAKIQTFLVQKWKRKHPFWIWASDLLSVTRFLPQLPLCPSPYTLFREWLFWRLCEYFTFRYLPLYWLPDCLPLFWHFYPLPFDDREVLAAFLLSVSRQLTESPHWGENSLQLSPAWDIVLYIFGYWRP